MSLDYGILVLILGALYAILVKYVPDFPLDEGTLLVIILYVLGKFGISITRDVVVKVQEKRAAVKAAELKAKKLVAKK